MKLLSNQDPYALIKTQPCTGLVIKEENLPDQKRNSVTVEEDERYRKISINKEVQGENFIGGSTSTKIKTEIVKDKLLETKETHIKKVFVTDKKDDMKQFIVREIYIDELSGRKKVTDRKVEFQVPSDELIEDILTKLINQEETDLTHKQIEKEVLTLPG